MRETELDSGLTYAIDTSHRGEPTPDVVFNAPDGDPITLERFRGRPLVVNLWATWCAPCVKELPTLNALAAREAGRVAVVTVAQDIAGRDTVMPYLNRRALPRLKAYTDPDNMLMTALGARELPLTVIYDAYGRETARVLGAMSWDGDRAAALIDDARGSPP